MFSTWPICGLGTNRFRNDLVKSMQPLLPSKYGERRRINPRPELVRITRRDLQPSIHDIERTLSALIRAISNRHEARKEVR